MSGKGGSIPSWQRSAASPPTPAQEPTPTTPATASEDTSEPNSEAEAPSGDADDIKKRAARFLQDPAIKDASRERKATFLESKGIDKAEIQSLLGNESDGIVESVRCDLLRCQAYGLITCTCRILLKNKHLPTCRRRAVRLPRMLPRVSHLAMFPP